VTRLLGDRTFTVYRWGAVSEVDGELIEGTETDFEVVGSLQPMTDRELLALPEGQRTRATWKLYVSEPAESLRTVDQGAETVADKVDVDGVLMSVLKVMNYRQTRLKLDHTRYALLEPERPDEVVGG